MAEFQEQQLFQGAAQSQGFAPMQAPDTSRFLRENMGTIDANFARMQSQQEAVNKRKLNEQQRLLETLGQFSTTAMEIAQTLGKNYIDNEILKGHTKARSLGKTLNYGVDPAQEQMFKLAEKEAKVDSSKFSTVALDMAKQNAPMEAVNYIKGLSSYQRIGATQAYLANKGNTYKQFISQFLQRTDINLPKPGGGTFTPNEAYQDSSLMGIALSAASEIFDAQEVGIGADFSPSKLAMKELYAKKDEVEASFINNASRENNVNESSDRRSKATDLWINNKDPNALLAEFTGTYDENGNIIGRDGALDLIFDQVFVNAYKAGDKTVKEQLESPILDENGNPTGQTWGERFKNRVTKLNATFESIDRQERIKKDENYRDAVKEEKDRLEAAIIAQREAGGEINIATYKAMRKEAAKRLQIPEESPDLDFYKTYLSQESRDDQVDIDALNALRNPITGRGFLILSDLEGKSQAVQDQFLRYVDEDQGIAQRPKQYISDNEKYITALTNEHFKVTVGDAPKTPEWESMARRAREKEAQYYAEAIRDGMTAPQAQAETRKRLEANFKKGTYTYDPELTSSVKYRRTLESARRTTALDPDSPSKTIFYGTDNELKELERYDKGFTNVLPKFYHDLAVGNKKRTAWDFASAQYKVATGKTLRAAQQQQAFQSKSKAWQTFMNWRPNPNKGRRADAVSFRSQTSSLPNPTLKRAADIVANYESAGAGGYNAVNQGGSAGGTSVPAGFYSGDFRNMAQHGGRALTSLTVGEVMNLQADPGSSMSNDTWVKKGKLHAVGRYQFIGSTLKGLVQRLGISMNAKFTPQLQDQLFLSLLKSGGASQWVGLRYASPEEMSIINQARSQL